MSRPQTKQLISGPLSSELELIEFLRPYKRVRADAVCQKPVDASQVTVWVFKNGEWLQTKPTHSGKSGSWCHSALAAILGLSPAEYAVAKKEMFSPQDGLNGVYESQKKYTLVYRPSQRWSNRTKAAIAGGAALVGGLGLAGTRYAMRGRSGSTQAVSKPCQTSDELTAITDELSRIKSDLEAMLNDENVELRSDRLDEYRAFLGSFDQKLQTAADKSTKSKQDTNIEVSNATNLEARVRQLMMLIEGLSKIGVSNKNILSLWQNTYADIIKSSDWEKIDAEFPYVFEFLRNHPEKLAKFEIAHDFNQVIQNRKSVV